MKTLKKILIGIVGIVTFLLIAALFVKKEYTIEQEIIINKPYSKVFSYIKHLKNQEKYSKWVMTDSNMKKNYRGTDGTVGFVYAWNGNDQAGQGEQEIKGITEGKDLNIEVRFIRPFENIAQTPFTTEAISENQTKVKWGMTGGNPYTLNLMHLFKNDLLSTDLEVSLKNFKTILEKESPKVTALE